MIKAQVWNKGEPETWPVKQEEKVSSLGRRGSETKNRVRRRHTEYPCAICDLFPCMCNDVVNSSYLKCIPVPHLTVIFLPFLCIFFSRSIDTTLTQLTKCQGLNTLISPSRQPCKVMRGMTTLQVFRWGSWGSPAPTHPRPPDREVAVLS